MEHLVKDDQYYIEHPAEWDGLGEDDRTKFLAGDFEPVLKVDTDTDTKTAEELAADKVKEEEAAAAAAAGDGGEKKVIQAKDGENIIPYSELEDSRGETATAKAEVVRLEGVLKENTEALSKFQTDLEAAKLKDEAAAGDDVTAAQDQILQDFEKDYSEIHKAVVALVGNKVGTKLEAIETKLNQMEEKDQASETKTAEELKAAEEEKKHFNSIQEAHSDFTEIIKSEKWGEWLKGQPSYVQAVTKDGDSAQVAELFQTFKDANPEWKKADDPPEKTEVELAAEKEATKVAAKKALEGAEPDTPASLTDLAGGKVHIDEAEAMKSEGGTQLMGRFANKTPDQIEDLINKAV